MDAMLGFMLRNSGWKIKCLTFAFIIVSVDMVCKQQNNYCEANMCINMTFM